MSKVDHVISAENRLRRYLERHCRGAVSYLYNYCCGPHYCVSREQFNVIVQTLAARDFLEVVPVNHRPWLMRKDTVAAWRQQQDVTKAVQP